MFNWISDMAIPFMLATGAAPPKLSFTRVIEALMIAGVASIASSYLTVQRLEYRQETAEKYIAEQIVRRNTEVMMIREQAKIAAEKGDRQYENLRTEIIRLALAMERIKK